MKYRTYIDESLEKDLKDIVDMSWEEERRHWDEVGCPKKHIYHSLNNLRNFLIKLKNETPIDIEEWVKLADEDLWQDGELNHKEVRDLIYFQVVKQGVWRIQRLKENDAK